MLVKGNTHGRPIFAPPSVRHGADAAVVAVDVVVASVTIMIAGVVVAAVVVAAVVVTVVVVAVLLSTLQFFIAAS